MYGMAMYNIYSFEEKAGVFEKVASFPASVDIFRRELMVK